MQYCDIAYLVVFLPLVMLIYHFFPKKKKFWVLLFFSYVFFYLLSGKLLVYLILTTFSIHHFGLWLHDMDRWEADELAVALKEEKKEIKKTYLKKKKRILFLGILIQLGLLASFKYVNFFCLNVNHVLSLFKIPFKIKQFKIIAPIGISFYTLEAISYLVDVFRGKIQADKKLSRLALYLAFFPQVMEGPIARYEETAMQIYRGDKLQYHNICFGFQRIFYGLMKKMIVADRLNIIVKNIFLHYADYNGGVLLLGVIFYTIQLYMDFSGVMDVVIGTGEIFGVKLPENFRQPFFAKNISDFWARWHITLGTWFKDYIFYPISLSKFAKKMTSTLRKKIGNHFGPLIAGSIALFSVWFCNGLWHGAGYHYLFFGMYHFFFILMGSLWAPLFVKFYELTKINRDGVFVRIIGAIRTTILVLFGELFFRAPSLKVGFIMLKRIFSDFSLESIKDKFILQLGLDGKDFLIIGIVLLIVFVISLLREKQVQIREAIAKWPIGFRWGLYYVLILGVLIFGAYGPGYVPVDPMYADF